MSESTHIRFARTEDAQAILDIYAPYIATPVTFEEHIPSLSELEGRIESVSCNYPFLVAEARGKVVGYAYAHPLREREAYQWNAELSIYLAPAAQGHGLGKKLYTLLIELVKLQGAKAVYGIVTAPNIASRHLHLSLGFERLMLQKNAGYKCGEWRDMQWFVKYVGEFEDNPAPLTPFPKLYKDKAAVVDALLDGANEG